MRISYLGLALLLLGLVIIGSAYAGYPLSVVSTPSLHYSGDANASIISSITKSPDGYTIPLSTLYNPNNESNPWVFGLSYYNSVTPSVPITVQYYGSIPGKSYTYYETLPNQNRVSGSGISKWAKSASGTINETVYVTNESSGQTTQHTIPVSVAVSVSVSTGPTFYYKGIVETYYAIITASGTYTFYDPASPNTAGYPNSAEYAISFGTAYGTISDGNTSYSILLVGSIHYSSTSTSSTLTFGNTEPIYCEFGSSPSISNTTNFTYGNFWVGTSLSHMERVTPSEQALSFYTSTFPATLYVVFVFNGSIPSNYINVFYSYQIFDNSTTPTSSGIVNFYDQPTTSVTINGQSYPYAFVSTLNITTPSDVVLNGEYATGPNSSIPIMEIGGFSDNAPVQPAFSTQQYISFGIGAVLMLIGAVWIFKR